MLRDMKTVEEVRRANARALVDVAGGQQRFADRLDITRQQASHIVGHKRGSEVSEKNIGSDLARKIERAFGLEHAWMDHEHNELRDLRQDDETVDVPLLAAAASAGDGAERADDQVVQIARISKPWLRQNASSSSFSNLAMLTARGDSMTPTFEDGSILLVDRGVRHIKLDAIYVLAREDELFVKRVQRRIGGGLSIISDNPAYAAQPIEDPGASGLQVLGRVLLAWHARKL